MVNFEEEEKVTWLHVPKGGYGYIIPVDAIVKKIGKKRIKLEVTTKHGKKKTVWVTPTSLKKLNGVIDGNNH